MYLEYFSEYHTYNLQSGTHLLVLQEPPAVHAASPHEPTHAAPEGGEESAELSYSFQFLQIV